MVTSLRAMATMTSLCGVPRILRRCATGFSSGLGQAAASAAWNRTCRSARRPPAIARLPRIVPLSCGTGARPVMAATSPSALFPHRQRLAPHGFVLPRFVNVDRHHPMAAVALRSTSKNLSESRRSEHNVECQVCGSAENPAAQSRSRNFCIFAGSLSGMRSASDTVEAGNTARQSTTAACAFSDCPRAA